MIDELFPDNGFPSPAGNIIDKLNEVIRALNAAERQPTARISAMVPCPHWYCLDDCVWQDEKSGAKVTCSDAGPCVFRARHQ